ncbi:LacI family DNA-binding transcriptional regulator [Seleniivibrio woodruffii]|uniref:LacI family DNA-binding transcriptional regulator n=1 Tax=Seleniivibrio woodruffii TaxID=1078050 RepID=UPI002409A342|nr:LacI family DNA-binding transcriptional regulator [Seleniivibrio woodruffii]
MKKTITITEIAKLADVSVSTVSLVLNGKTGVGPAVRERVQRIAREHNYKGTTFGGMNKKHKTILFVNIVKHGHILNINHQSFVADYINAAQMEAAKKSYSLEVAVFNSFNPDEITEYVNNSFASGAVILGTELDEPDVEHFLKIHIPLVFIDILCPFMPYDFVDMNNASSVFNMMSYLTRMGHSSIGIVTGSIESINFRQRMDSFEGAMKHFGHKFRKDFVFRVDSTYEKAYEDMLEILKKQKELPTALFCANDIIALGCMRALRESGYSIPEDISVAGYDNLPMSAMTEPALTTVDVSKKSISTKAVRLLVQRIKEGSGMPYEKTVIGGEVVERRSVKNLSGEEE